MLFSLTMLEVLNLLLSGINETQQYPRMLTSKSYHNKVFLEKLYLKIISIYPTQGPVASPTSMRSVLTSGSCLSSPPPPPPPPPGPPPIFDTETPPKDEGTASRSALFAQLNQGEAITKGQEKRNQILTLESNYINSCCMY